MKNQRFLIVSLFFLLIKESEQVGDIARKKCDEYSKYVYVDEYSPVLHANTKIDSVSKCGLVEVPLIIGGVNAHPIEFPHMAAIGFGEVSDFSWLCGGTLISEKFVMTAGHCVSHREKGKAKRVLLGTTKLKDQHANTFTFPIADIYLHPNYSARSKYNDIALLQLVKNITFSEFIRPACLNFDHHLTWSTALATGFGRLTYDSENGSADLMKVQLRRISKDDCRNIYKNLPSMKYGVISSQFCAGEMAGKKDTCQGDSGGPLQTVLRNPYCMYNIIGITSFGKFCGFENSPGIYTNVAYFIDWIENIVWT